MISSSITAYLIMGFFMIHGSMVIIGITRLVNLVDDPDHLFDQLFVYGGENRQEKLTKFELISCCFIVYWFVIPWSLATPSDKIF